MDKPAEDTTENGEVVTRYEINIAGFVTSPVESFNAAISKARDVYSRLTKNDESKVPSANEFKKHSHLSEDEEKALEVFRAGLREIFTEMRLYGGTNLLAEVSKVLAEEAKACDLILEMNLNREHNLAKKETLGKKQLHRDYIVLRGVILQMAKILQYPIDPDNLPPKPGNYSDDLPISRAEVAFYSHHYVVQEFDVKRDPETGIPDDEKFVRVREFPAGDNPTNLAWFVGLMNTLTRQGIVGFIEALGNLFSIANFEGLPEDFDNSSDPAFAQVGDKVYILQISPRKEI